MTFVQPYILYGLPLVALPILIHLLNRLRYRSVKWGAMMFLLSATKSSIKRARLKHYLILALRTLAVLFLLLALARPIAGGWLGALAGGAPETIFLVLDRSSSMESVGRSLKSVREHAVEMLQEGARLIRGNVRFVLAESATLAVQEVPGTDALEDLSLCTATSSAADMPALLGKVLEYALENRCGNMELWVASDMQSSSWRTGSPAWASLKERYRALPQGVRIRILSLSAQATPNVMVELMDARRAVRAGGDTANVSVRLERNIVDQPLALPVGITLGGVRQQEEIEIDGPGLWLMRSVPLPDEVKGAGWGVVELPADGNISDNSSYFAYGGEVSQLSALVAKDPSSARILGIASAPDPKGMNQVCLQTPLSKVGDLDWSKLSLLVWQEDASGSKEASVESFCRQGGTVLLLPPGRKGDGMLGVRWGDLESAPAEMPFSVVSWESMEGPLARTGDGKDLPVSGLQIKRRQGVGQSDDALLRLRTYASYRDGKPFLMGGRLGDGHVYICTTLPSPGWSDLSRGTVLVPMMQRLLRHGAVRLGGAENGDVGLMWRTSEGEDWVCIDDDAKNPLCDAGVYRMGGKLVALNVPASEFDQDVVDEEDVRRALEGMEVEFVDSDVGDRKKNSASEIWPVFVFLMGLALLSEAAMLTGDRLIRKDAESI